MRTLNLISTPRQIVDFHTTIPKASYPPTALLVMVLYLTTPHQELCLTLKHQVLCLTVTAPHLAGMHPDPFLLRSIILRELSPHQK